MISVISCEIVWEKEAICGEDFDLKANNTKTVDNTLDLRPDQ